MTIAQGQVLKAVLTHDLPLDSKAQNVFYWVVAGFNPVDESDTLDVIETALEAMWALIEDNLTTAVTLESLVVHEWDYDPVEGWETGLYLGTRTPTGAGLSAGHMMPHATACTITAFSPDVKTRSRKSIAGLSETFHNQSELTGSTLTDLVAFAAAWLSYLTINGADHLEPVIPAKDGSVLPLIAALVSDIVGSQRQRKPGIGI